MDKDREEIEKYKKLKRDFSVEEKKFRRYLKKYSEFYSVWDDCTDKLYHYLGECLKLLSHSYKDVAGLDKDWDELSELFNTLKATAFSSFTDHDSGFCDMDSLLDAMNRSSSRLYWLVKNGQNVGKKIGLSVRGLHDFDHACKIGTLKMDSFVFDQTVKKLRRALNSIVWPDPS